MSPDIDKVPTEFVMIALLLATRLPGISHFFSNAQLIYVYYRYCCFVAIVKLLVAG